MWGPSSVGVTPNPNWGMCLAIGGLWRLFKPATKTCGSVEYISFHLCNSNSKNSPQWGFFFWTQSAWWCDADNVPPKKLRVSYAVTEIFFEIVKNFHGNLRFIKDQMMRRKSTAKSLIMGLGLNERAQLWQKSIVNIANRTIQKHLSFGNLQNQVLHFDAKVSAERFTRKTEKTRPLNIGRISLPNKEPQKQRGSALCVTTPRLTKCVSGNKIL